jgi:DNA-binding response OmpR family regulator
MATRVLVVEDDDRIRSVLRFALEEEGYQVGEAADAETALVKLGSFGPNLMLVDLMLGEMDGFSCIRAVRRMTDIPIIIVSARVDTHDVVAGLEAGADDYVTKPFQIKEVTARIRALRRRTRPSGAEVPDDVVLDADPQGRLVLSPARGALRRGDRDVHLTLTEFRLLSELSTPPGRVLSRQTLLKSVWEHGFFGDERIVDVHIRRLRTKIERDPANPRLVVTVRGLGYRLDPA